MAPLEVAYCAILIVVFTALVTEPAVTVISTVLIVAATQSVDFENRQPTNHLIAYLSPEDTGPIVFNDNTTGRDSSVKKLYGFYEIFSGDGNPPSIYLGQYSVTHLYSGFYWLHYATRIEIYQQITFIGVSKRFTSVHLWYNLRLEVEVTTDASLAN